MLSVWQMPKCSRRTLWVLQAPALALPGISGVGDASSGWQPTTPPQLLLRRNTSRLLLLASLQPTPSSCVGLLLRWLQLSYSGRSPLSPWGNLCHPCFTFWGDGAQPCGGIPSALWSHRQLSVGWGWGGGCLPSLLPSSFLCRAGTGMSDASCQMGHSLQRNPYSDSYKLGRWVTN